MSRQNSNSSAAGNTLIVTETICIPHVELDFTYSRSSGPGGQNVNKVNTRVQMRWDATQSTALPEEVRKRFLEQNRSRVTTDGMILITSQRYRTQIRNVEDCLDKLRSLVLRATLVQKKRKPTRRTAASKRRRLADKRKRSERKQMRQSPKLND